jgi:hypothetical protein
MSFISGVVPLTVKIVQWLIPLIITVVVTILLQDHLHWTLVRILGAVVPRPSRSVKGIWTARYVYPGEGGKNKEEQQFIELRQLGKYVHGKNLTSRQHWYRMTGKLELESYLTGVWENIPDGDIHHGAFQFVVSPDGNCMHGKWIGFNRRMEICHGPWEWNLVSRSANRKAKRVIMSKEQK